jgi:hypothetical protein
LIALKKMAHFKYLVTTVTNQNFTREEIKRADYTHRMPATNRPRIFYLPVCYQKVQRLKSTAPYFCQLFNMGVKLGRPL